MHPTRPTAARATECRKWAARCRATAAKCRHPLIIRSYHADADRWDRLAESLEAEAAHERRESMLIAGRLG